MDFSKIVNIAFILHPKVTPRDVIFFPAVSKQQGKVNYIVVCEGQYSGVYKWTEEIRPYLRIWNNGKLPCYVITKDKLTKLKDLDQIDERLPLGKFMLRIIKKIQRREDD